jgi:hypothetical protein
MPDCCVALPGLVKILPVTSLWEEKMRFIAPGAAVVLATTPVLASPLFFGASPYLSKDDSPFIDQINSNDAFLEDFEDDLLNTPGVIASVGAPIGPGGLADSVDADDGAIDGSGTNGHSFFAGSGFAGITFTFDAAQLGGSLPTGAGIVWTDGAGSTLFEAFGPGGASLGTIGPVSCADGTFGGTTAEDRFFGVVDPAGISAIKISNTSGGIEVDHLQYGAVPVPEATLLLPVAGLFVITRRRARGERQ